MDVVYSDHAQKRLKQRGITHLEAEHVLKHPQFIKKSLAGKKIAVGLLRNRTITVVFIETENYIKIITIL